MDLTSRVSQIFLLLPLASEADDSLVSTMGWHAACKVWGKLMDPGMQAAPVLVMNFHPGSDLVM
ncbi:hypothetical protein POSPLADRAFT_1056388 [Postia placenta MAD-698-R-SB12]|uniref:Uncharacterized protein n=1 Tax=Postia placenta MAD-698-R-SB12 TaxID=670580 RepID=A0A1X6N358_9APHY|nr:hypothetical protein POSPLADRAFT_1056388 [Postia placenta MAD-698-R-SB12]OSX63038.1 hypothetical protein POSPLADRAFT_1056388 [Postia placenta MAD-698-R-SB12]